jgi:hypothetical protein
VDTPCNLSDESISNLRSNYDDIFS